MDQGTVTAALGVAEGAVVGAVSGLATGGGVEGAVAGAIQGAVATAPAGLPQQLAGLETRVTSLEAQAANAVKAHPALVEVVSLLGKYFPHEVGPLVGLLGL